MSRAFVKESEPDSPIDLPDRPISPIRNLMTETGFAAMQRVRDRLVDELNRCSGADGLKTPTRIAELRRDIKYYTRRLQTAEVVKSPAPDTIRFGHWVQFTDGDGAEYCFCIVGEDEADVSENKISWASPLATELIGKRIGDTCRWRKRDQDILVEISTISQTQPALI